MSIKPDARNAGEVHIPKSALHAELGQTAALKRDMTKQLAELESRAARRPIAQPGGWRHDPTGWAERNL
jgi:hypothetical protein